MKDIAQMSQNSFDRLLNQLAGVLRTQRRFIKIVSEQRIDPCLVHYRVKVKGTYYLYSVAVMEVANRFIVNNRGLIL